jgi:hypothetical protein
MIKIVIRLDQTTYNSSYKYYGYNVLYYNRIPIAGFLNRVFTLAELNVFIKPRFKVASQMINTYTLDYIV